MTRSPADIDLMDPATQADPFDAYRVLREQAPVWRMAGPDWYVVSSYALLDRVIRNPAIFSIEIGRYGQAGLFRTAEARRIFREKGWVVGTKLSTDPPVHDDYRRLVNVSFTARRVAQSESFIRSLISELIDGFAERGACEFVADYCVPLPMKVIAERMGLPFEDLPRLKLWSEAWVEPFSYAMSPERELAVARLLVEFQHYLVDKLDEKRRAPRGDILSDLATGRFAGERELNTEEALGIAEQILVGGNETTANAIASGMLLLLRTPAVLRALRDDPARIRTFVEETLRLESPTQGLFRITTCDTVLGGVEIPKDAWVHLRFGAANRDPEVFPEPDRLDLERRNAGAHMAFSQGEHHCLGAPLARQEMCLSFEMLLERLDEIRLAPGFSGPSYVPGFTLRALTQLPLEFSAR